MNLGYRNFKSQQFLFFFMNCTFWGPKGAETPTNEFILISRACGLSCNSHRFFLKNGVLDVENKWLDNFFYF